ncbi:MAG TPA: tRNA (adenosine(37)-N6)-threonylcarbamoyltransferase complex ATPase subunit type 1 TsaE [Candidatus Paceibacterota bacterium]
MEKIRLEDVDAYVAKLIQSLPARTTASLIALSGDLGAGKTTLAQAIGRTLGVKEKIPSPTFLVMRSYATHHPRFSRFVHIDAYRVESVDELKLLGFEKILKEEETLICVEWPERIESLLPREGVHIHFKNTGEREREIDVRKT